MKRTSLIPALILAAGCAFAQELETVTLTEAVKIALSRHPDVGKAKAAADALKGKITEVRAQALPEITINGGGMRMRDPSFLNSSSLDNFPPELRDALDPVGSNIFLYNLTVKQPLYTAGKIGTALRLASVEAEGSLAEIDRAEQDLALEVAKAYYALLWAERYRENVAETQQQRKAHADMARTRFQNGVATEVDVLRSEVEVANGQPDMVRAENAIRQARALLNFYLVRPANSPTKVAGTFQEQAWEEWDVEKLTVDAFRSRPELARLRIGERSAAAMLDLAKAEGRFRADLSTEYGIMSRLPKNLFNSNFTRWTLGVNFSLPVFDGFRRSGLVTQAVANQRSARLEREKVEQQVRLGIQQGLDELNAARETVSATRANINQAERVLEMTQANYKYGAATTLDIVDAQTALSVARTNLLRGLHD
ncbi:MAG TPA: TolC family protein, partial [Bryobacteraceae bacterium]|nr:TolC family protein [Bryobacteraceae bacterium]